MERGGLFPSFRTKHSRRFGIVTTKCLRWQYMQSAFPFTTALEGDAHYLTGDRLDLFLQVPLSKQGKLFCVQSSDKCVHAAV